MEKTIKINLAGVIFQINEDGFELLRDYLQSITKRLKNIAGGNEMIEDIEARISEIFQSAASWKTGVISKQDVEEMMSTMGSAEEIAGDLEGDTAYEKRLSDRKMYRDPENAIIGGVCSGLANYLRIDAVWVRIIFVLFSIFYLSGLFVYIVLWIALPKSVSPYQKSEMSKPGKESGKTDNTENISYARPDRTYDSRIENSAGKVGSAFNEIFKAFGKFFIILFRIVLALIGVTFIISGFSLLFSFVLIAFFNSTSIMGTTFDTELFHLPDLLAFIVNPSLTPWLMVLSSLVIILPLLALIYWGVRMVFQFKVRDLVLNITMFILWILSCTALSIIMFSEGISFNDSGRTYEQIAIPDDDTIYLRLGEDISSIVYDKEVSLPFEQFSLYLNEETKKIYGSPEIDIYPLDEDAPYLQIVKYSNGNTRNEAMKKADNLEYNYELRNNNLYLDEFFGIPAGNRWSGASLKVRVYLPQGKIVYLEEGLENVLDEHLGHGVYSYEVGGHYWMVGEFGLEEIK